MSMASGMLSHPPPWYRAEIGTRLKPRARRLFEDYSKIDPRDVEGHLYAVVSTLDRYPSNLTLEYNICLFSPSIRFDFNNAHDALQFSVKEHELPWFDELLTRVKGGALILDLGCCFGQDLRYIAAEGAPTQNMFSSDLIPELWDLSFDLYRDTGSMLARFLQADILDSASALKQQLSGTMDIILINQVFHLFDWDRQVEAGKNLVALSRTGTWVVGYHIGSAVGRAVPVRVTTGGTAGTAGGSSKFFHTPDTWRTLWGLVGEKTDSQWVVQSSLHDMDEWGWETEDSAWMGPAARGFEFLVRRVDGLRE